MAEFFERDLTRRVDEHCEPGCLVLHRSGPHVNQIIICFLINKTSAYARAANGTSLAGRPPSGSWMGYKTALLRHISSPAKWHRRTIHALPLTDTSCPLQGDPHLLRAFFPAGP